MSRREPPIVFIHIPKTAGSTLVAILGRNFPNSRVHVPNVFSREEEMHRRIGSHRARKAQVFHGHMPLSVRDEFPRGSCFVTFLREPIARAYSNYRHTYNELIEGGKAPPIEEPQLPDNLQARMLCGLTEPFTRPADDALLAAALHEVRQLTFYGVMEHFAESLLLARERLGLRWVAYRRENLRPQADMPDRYLKALRVQNELDVELYTQAVSELEPELARYRRKARSLERAGDALTGGRPSADPRALAYVMSYGLACGDAGVRRNWLRNWRRWRVVRALRKTSRRR